jgi:hypothetical protein
VNTINVTIEGAVPLLMHNPRLANPLDPYAMELKKLTAKRQKTEDDHIAIARVEFLGSLYYERGTGVYLPGENIEACIRDGAKIKKRGVKVKRGVMCQEFRVPLTYDGPKTPEQLWDLPEFRDIRSAKTQQARVMRCRPIFREWRVSFTLTYQPDIIDPDEVRQSLHDAGEQACLGDYRPRYGKFAISQWKVNSNGR